MRTARRFVIASAIATWAIFGAALFSSAGMKSELASTPILSIGISLLVAFVCSWPWLITYDAVRFKDNEGPAYIFCVVALLIAAGFAVPIFRSPAEGVGWMVVFSVLSIWGAFGLIGRFTYTRSTAAAAPTLPPSR